MCSPMVTIPSAFGADVAGRLSCLCSAGVSQPSATSLSAARASARPAGAAPACAAAWRAPRCAVGSR